MKDSNSSMNKPHKSPNINNHYQKVGPDEQKVVQPAGDYLNWSPKAPHQYDKQKKLKTRKRQKYIALRQKNFRRKISFCGANVRYTTPLYPTLHPVTPLQNKGN